MIQINKKLFNQFKQETYNQIDVLISLKLLNIHIYLLATCIYLLYYIYLFNKNKNL